MQQGAVPRRLDGKRIALIVLLLAIVVGAVAISIVYLRRDPVQTAAQEALDRRDFAGARRLLDQGLSANPKDPSLRLLAARAARRAGDLDAAQNHLHVCERSSPSFPGLDLERRLLVVQQGDLTAADALLVECARSSGSSDAALMLEAVIEGSLKSLFEMFAREERGQGQIISADFARAQRAVDQWLIERTGPVDQAQGFLWRGKLHSLARDTVQAVQAFRKAVEIDPGHSHARELLATAIISSAPKEAAEHLEMLRKRDPGNHKVAFALAKAWHALGQLEQADQLLNELLAAEPDHAALLLLRGNILLDQRRPADAEKWLRRAVQLAPHHPEANLRMSQCLDQTNRPSEARQYHDKYLQSKK